MEHYSYINGAMLPHVHDHFSALLLRRGIKFQTWLRLVTPTFGLESQPAFFRSEAELSTNAVVYLGPPRSHGDFWDYDIWAAPLDTDAARAVPPDSQRSQADATDSQE